jgi:CheY-like chemotaxis protein
VPRAAAPPSASSISAATARSILVVDDNADCANTLGMLLQVSGHKVETAYSGVQALELAARTSPDIVFLDIGLPGMNGYEVARRMRQIERSNPLLLIAVSGYGQDDDRRQSTAAGFDLHLIKPVSLERLNEVFSGPRARADG